MPPSSTVNSRRGPLWLRSLLWLMALLLALGSMVYQKTTGPTYPQRGSFEMNGRTHDYSLLRSDESSRSSRDARVELPDPGQPAGGRIHWRRFPTEDPFVSAPLSREAGEDGEALLVGLLPAQPAAGKLEYFLSLESPGQAPLRIPDKTVIIRFKDCVPTAILLPHVLLMALSILVGLRAGMGALFTPGSMRLWAWITLGTITVGGMILGPLVQKHAFGEYWTGWPLGGDWTDNKALFMWLAWLAAVLVMGRGSTGRPLRSRVAVLLATLAMMAVYVIPHSMGGSELDYSAVDQGLDPAEAIRTGRQ